MISGLYASLSGLQASQTLLDVSANNVANVNTNGFKASRLNQAASFVQTVVAPSANRPTGLSVGSGTQSTGTSTNFSTGAQIQTGNSGDLSIQGPGFFEVVGPNGNTYFTRNGDFVKDAQGFLRTPEGAYLSAGGSAVQVPSSAINYTVASNGTVTAIFGNGSSTPIANIDVATFANYDGLLNTGGGLYKPTPASGLPDYVQPGTGGAGTLSQGTLEASNVDVTSELVNQIIGLRSFQANARVISVENETAKTLIGIFTPSRT